MALPGPEITQSAGNNMIEDVTRVSQPLCGTLMCADGMKESYSKLHSMQSQA